MKISAAKSLSLKLLFLESSRKPFYLLLSIALLLHLIPFFLIQLENPSSLSIPKIFPKITFINIDKDNPKDYFSFWVENTDPSFFLLEKERTSLPKIKPIIIQSRIQPLEMPREEIASIQTSTEFLSEQWEKPQNRVERYLEPKSHRFTFEQPRIQTSNTSQGFIEIGKNLQPRLKGSFPKLPQIGSSFLNESGVTILNVGIHTSGKKNFALIKESCGQSAVDLKALEIFRRIEFKPSHNKKMQWGRVKFYWEFKPQ